MGRRGPAPKPTALKLVGGNPGNRPLNGSEPVPPAGEPDVPAWVIGPSLEIWRQLVPGLSRVGLARRIDGVVLGRYCVLLHRWIEAIEFIRKNGPTYPVRAEPRGDQRTGRVVAVREFPQNAEMRRLNQQLLVLEREFGLTPAARTRITVNAEQAVKGDVNELKRRFFGQGS